MNCSAIPIWLWLGNLLTCASGLCNSFGSDRGSRDLGLFTVAEVADLASTELAAPIVGPCSACAKKAATALSAPLSRGGAGDLGDHSADGRRDHLTAPQLVQLLLGLQWAVRCR